MPEETITQRLSEALNTYDWPLCEKLCEDLINDLDLASEPYPEKDAKKILNLLRRKRRFLLMARVADAFIRTGQTAPQIVRQYAQSMIDQGNLTAPQMMLKSIIDDPDAPADEKAEATGLLGRIYKQLYVNAGNAANPRQQANLRQAIQLYYSVYKTDPTTYFWHGINTVALVARALRDHIAADEFPRPEEIAHQIDAALKTISTLKYWDQATAAENAIALGDWNSAYDHVLYFLADHDVDGFEVASLLRQLTEVWQLPQAKEPGNTLLATLRAGLLRRECGCVQVQPANLAAESTNARQAKDHLEKVFGTDRYQPLGWYRMGLQRCEAVARIETVTGTRIGTGFLVRAADFFRDRDAKELILLTNAHVISPAENPFPGAIPPEAARVVFEATGKTHGVTGLCWSSPPAELDATFVTLEPLGDAAELCPLTPSPEAFDRNKQQRVYVIGYPLGGGLSISLQDSAWLDTSDKFLHYRTPTDPGSSGSPVFDQQYWTVIAIHHAGEKSMPRLNGEPGTYEANEGIAMSAIRKATLQEQQKSGAAEA